MRKDCIKILNKNCNLEIVEGLKNQKTSWSVLVHTFNPRGSQIFVSSVYKASSMKAMAVTRRKEKESEDYKVGSALILEHLMCHARFHCFISHNTNVS